MPARLRSNRGRHRPAPRVCPSVELLETRLLPSTTPLPAPVLEITGTNTLNLSSPVQVQGNIGTGPAGAADVDWYNFTLAQASRVTLAAAPQSGQADPVVSLYNNDPFDFNDLYDPLGHRLVAQAQGSSGGPTSLTESLAPGTYFVAISGAGNLYFHPLLEGSGYPGSTGAYSLQVTTAGLGLSAGNGPVLLETSPGAGTAVNSSPLTIRVDLSGSLDPNSVIAGQTVNLLYSPTANFASATAVPLSNVAYSDQIAELQLTAASALAPGYYQIVLSGNASGGAPVLTSPSGTPLGKDATHANGQDYTAVFQVAGVDGTPGVNAPSDDSPTTAHVLGDITGAGLVQATGAIGTDPAYNFSSPDPFLFNPAAQVDLYKFQISGQGKYALTTEVFAGRIGSPLDPALSLWQRDPSSGHLVLLASNDNTLDNFQATDGSQPLANDPALFAGLSAGTYYVAVSGTGNLPDPNTALGLLPGTNGIFDANVSHSGMNGFTTGNYVLNLAVQAASATAPQVTGVTLRVDTNVNDVTGIPAAGASLTSPPTIFDVQFSEPVNLQQLLYETSQQNPTATGLDAVYVSVPPTALNPQSVTYHPRLLDYNSATGVARFLMLDAIPSGPYAAGQTPALHLSGVGLLGITDLAGNALAGNDPSGDYVVPFTVSAPPRGTGSNPLLWTYQPPHTDLNSPQTLGVLFPDELHSKVVLQRTASPTASDQANYYSFSVLQGRDYILSIQGTDLPTFNRNQPTTPTTPAPPFAIWSVAQQQWLTGSELGSSGLAFQFTLNAGQYLVKVGDWTTAQAPLVTYQLSLGLANSLDNPPPLTLGPAPAIRLLPPTAPTAPMPPATPITTSDVGPPLDSPTSLGTALSAPSVSPGIVALAASPGVAGSDIAAGILLARATSPIGVRAGGDTETETVAAVTHTDAAPSPSLASFLVLTFLTVAPDGAVTAPDEVAPVPAPDSVGGGPSRAAPGVLPGVDLPAEPEVVASGMPAKAALDALFELDALRTGHQGGWDSARLPDDLTEQKLAGFGPGAADEAATTKKRWLDLLTLASLGASLTLGGWSAVRLRRRRPAGAPVRICWGGEDSSDFPE